MQKIFLKLILVIVCSSFSSFLFSQKLYKATEKVYKEANSFYDAKNYDVAADNYITVLNNIPANIDDRKYQVMRLESSSTLVVYYMEVNNSVEKACHYLNVFKTDLNKYKTGDEMKTKQIFKYLELETEFGKYVQNCAGFKSINDKKSNFEKNAFDQVFGDDDDQ